MTDHDYSMIETTVVNAKLHDARLVREMLARLGFKRTEVFDTAERATSHLAETSTDLLLVDCDGEPDLDAFALARSVRGDTSLPNPYAAIVVTTWEATRERVARTTNCGADALLIKPFSPRQLLDRIEGMIEARRRYVVTADYVGPDRRRSPREGARIPLFDVPNTLRLKAVGMWNKVSPRTMIADANALISEQRFLRAGIQVGFLVEYAAPGSNGVADRSAIDHIARVPRVLEDMARRVPYDRKAALEGHMGAIIDLVRRVSVEGEVDTRADWAALRDRADKLVVAIDPDRDPNDIRREIKTAVVAYTARLEALLQARAGGDRTTSDGGSVS